MGKDAFKRSVTYTVQAAMSKNSLSVHLFRLTFPTVLIFYLTIALVMFGKLSCFLI